MSAEVKHSTEVRSAHAADAHLGNRERISTKLMRWSIYGGATGLGMGILGASITSIPLAAIGSFIVMPAAFLVGVGSAVASSFGRKGKH